MRTITVLATKAVAVVFLCLANSAIANSNIFFGFESGIPSQLSIEGVGWETRNGADDADGFYLANKALARGESTSISFSVHLDEPAILSYRHRTNTYNRGALTFSVNGESRYVQTKHDQWQTDSMILERGQTTLTWETDVDSHRSYSPERVYIDSIKIERVNEADQSFHLNLSESVLFPDSERTKSSIERIGGETRVVLTIPRYPDVWTSENSAFSIFTQATASGHLIAKENPVEAFKNRPPKFFSINGKDYISVQKKWDPVNEGHLELIEQGTRNIVSRKRPLFNGEGYVFGDINKDAKIDLLYARGRTIKAIEFESGDLLWERDLAEPVSDKLILADLTHNPGQELILTGKPGYILSATNGQTLWRYSLGFYEPINLANFDGDHQSEFVSLDANGNLVTYDPRNRTPINVQSFESANTGTPLDIDGDGKDELVTFEGYGLFIARNGDTGAEIDQYQLPSDLRELTDIALAKNNDILATLKTGSPTSDIRHHAFVNVSTRKILGRSFMGAKEACCSYDPFDLSVSSASSGGSGHIYISDASMDSSPYRIHALSEDDLELDIAKTQAISALLPAGREVHTIAESIPNAQDSLPLYVGTIEPGWDNDPIIIYSIDPTSGILNGSFQAPELSNTPWKLYALGNDRVLAAKQMRLYIYDSKTGSVLWSSVAFDEEIDEIRVINQSGATKVFIASASYAALLDVDQGFYDYFESSPEGFQFLNSSQAGDELFYGSVDDYRKADNHLKILRTEDFSALATMDTGESAEGAWSMTVAGRPLLFISTEAHWLKVLSREGGEMLHLEDLGTPDMARGGPVYMLQSNAQESEFLTVSTTGIHRFKAALLDKKIFSDSFGSRVD